MEDHDIDRIADSAAQKALRNLFLTLGVNVDDPTEVQRDMAFIRNWRLSSEAVKRQGFILAVGVIITGMLGLVWTMVVNK